MRMEEKYEHLCTLTGNIIIFLYFFLSFVVRGRLIGKLSWKTLSLCFFSFFNLIWKVFSLFTLSSCAEISRRVFQGGKFSRKAKKIKTSFSSQFHSKAATLNHTNTQEKQIHFKPSLFFLFLACFHLQALSHELICTYTGCSKSQ